MLRDLIDLDANLVTEESLRDVEDASEESDNEESSVERLDEGESIGEESTGEGNKQKFKQLLKNLLKKNEGIKKGYQEIINNSKGKTETELINLLKSFSEDDELTLEFVNTNYYIGESFYHLQDYVSSYEYLKKSLLHDRNRSEKLAKNTKFILRLIFILKYLRLPLK